MAVTTICSSGVLKMTEEILTEEKIDALYQQRLDKASEMREEGESLCE